MAKQVVNVGVSANDNTGDYLRPAMIKINSNFSELYDHNDTLSTVAYTGDYSDLNNTPPILDFNGSYNDLEDLPALGTASEQDVEYFAISARGIPAGGSTGYSLVKTSDNDYEVEWAEVTSGGGIVDVVSDTSPQLGGDLDLNGFTILNHVIGTDIQGWTQVLEDTTASFTTADETKLDALPDNTSLNILLDAKAPIDSPTFTGTVTIPDVSAGDNGPSAANTKYVDSAITVLTTGAPLGLNTLDKIAASINDNTDFYGTMVTALALKAPLASPTFTGTPAGPTATGGTNTTQLATTAFVIGEIPTGAEMLTSIGLELSDDGAMMVNSNIITVEEVLPASGAADRFMILDTSGFYAEPTYPETREILYPNTSGIYQDIAKVTVVVELFTEEETIIVGDGAARWPVPTLYDGWTIGAVEMKNVTAGSGGSPLNVQLWNTDVGANVLSTALTIDLGETWSGNAAVPAVINATNNILEAGTWIRFDVDVVPTTPPEHLVVTMTLYPPVT